MVLVIVVKQSKKNAFNLDTIIAFAAKSDSNKRTAAVDRLFMTDLLTNQEATQAADQGWQLCHVFDQDALRWLIEVLPTKNNPIQSARRVQAIVLELARRKDAVALRAMSLVMGNNIPKKGKKK